MNKKMVLVFGILSVLLGSLLLSGCVTTSNYMVPMRDGVKLSTDVYLPKKITPAQGSILVRTPYNKAGVLDKALGLSWAKNGWVTVIQDMRGRYASEGNDTVFKNDRFDGADTLAWMANQTWSNGKIATWGASALGIVQYLVAGAHPPNLACQYVQVATPNLYKHAMFPGGEFRKALVEGWLKSEGSSYILPEILSHENYTLDYWTNVTLEDKWQQVNVPAIHIGGWYDIFMQGTIDGYLGYQHLAGPNAVGKSKLIIGPWTHTGAGQTRQGELTYPKNSVDNFSQALFWQMVNEYTMNGSSDVFDNWPAVTYYVMGDVNDSSALGNEWRQADDWPPAAEETAWYFQADGSLGHTPPGENTPLTYTYDPQNPVPTVGGANLNLKAGPYDQRSVENRSDVLVFTSPALLYPYEATGPVKARLFVSSDSPDTDFTVKLTDVYPDGRSMLITDGVLRMRNRNGTDHWEFMEPETVYQVDVDLWSTSYIWNTGHKIRVAVSSSNYPRCLNNPNTMDGIEKNTTYTVAHNTIYLDGTHSSCLLLPHVLFNKTGNQNWSPSQEIAQQQGKYPMFPSGFARLLERSPLLSRLYQQYSSRLL